MRNLEQTYSEILLVEYSTRRKRNPAYSFRAFANFLDVDSGTLSAILRGRRPIPKKLALSFAAKLNLSPQKHKAFLKSVNAAFNMKKLLSIQTPTRPELPLTDDQMILLTQWEYFAVLALLETNSFTMTVEQIGLRLEISLSRSKEVLETLCAFGFIDRPHKDYFGLSKLGKERGSAIADMPSLRMATKQSLELALQKLPKVAENVSHFESVTIAVSQSKVLEAQDLVIEFRKRLCSLLEIGEKDEVYMFNIQLFPLTNQAGK